MLHCRPALQQRPCCLQTRLSQGSSQPRQACWGLSPEATSSLQLLRMAVTPPAVKRSSFFEGTLLMQFNVYAGYETRVLQQV